MNTEGERTFVHQRSLFQLRGNFKEHMLENLAQYLCYFTPGHHLQCKAISLVANEHPGVETLQEKSASLKVTISHCWTLVVMNMYLPFLKKKKKNKNSNNNFKIYIYKTHIYIPC